MLRSIAIILTIVCLSFSSSSSADLPAKATYLFYIQGEYAGKCDIDVNEDGGLLVFRSASVLSWDDFKLDLHTRTKVDKETLQPRYYEYDGTRTGQKISGTVRADGDSLSGVNVLDGNSFPSGMRLTGPTYLFDNYVSDHQIIIARAIDRSDEPFLRFTIVLPSEFLPLPTVGTLVSEIELPTNPKPSVCKKFAVAMKNSAPYFLYLDPKLGIPLYMDFPSATTEVFLESAFGGKPVTKYVRPETTE
ncbi:MAG: hypothetical protein P8181_01840 [bacterium]